MKAALDLYERNKDPDASLTEFHRSERSRPTDSTTADSDEEVDKPAAIVSEDDDDDSIDYDDLTIPLSRRHNHAVLVRLASIASRRRRPLFTDADAGDDAGGDDDDKDDAVKKDTNEAAAAKAEAEGVEGAAIESEPPSSSAATNKKRLRPRPPSFDGDGEDDSSLDLAMRLSSLLRGEVAAAATRRNHKPPHIKEYNHLAGVYNVGLARYASGDGGGALTILLPAFGHSFLVESKEDTDAREDMAGGQVGQKNVQTVGQKTDQGFEDARTVALRLRAAFVILDCLFGTHAGNGRGLSPTFLDNGNKQDENDGVKDDEEEGGQRAVAASVSAEDVIRWIEGRAAAIFVGADEEDPEEHNADAPTKTVSPLPKEEELRFRLHLYRSRMYFLGNASQRDGGDMEEKESGPIIISSPTKSPTKGNNNNKRGKKGGSAPSKNVKDGRNDSSTGAAAATDSKASAETRLRLSRKELKSAMDLYQNRLCVVDSKGGKTADTGDDDDGEDNTATEGGSTILSSKHPNGKKGGRQTSRGGSRAESSGGGGGTTASVGTSTSDTLWNESNESSKATFEGMPGGKSGKAAPQLSKKQKQKLKKAKERAFSISSAPSAMDTVSGNGGGKGTAAEVSSAAGTVNTTAASSSKQRRLVRKRETPELEARRGIALCLKANLEYLRGNASKSLRLCAEARSAGRGANTVEGVHGEGGKGDGKSSGNGKDEIEEEGDSEGKHNINIENTETTAPPSAPPTITAESQMADDYTEAIHHNNLGLVHQTAGRVHVAVRCYTRALDHLERMRNVGAGVGTGAKEKENKESMGFENEEPFFCSDGTVRPAIAAQIFHNASLCAFEAREYVSSYRCMTRCVFSSSTTFGRRARCWLRMAESCIGIHADLQRKRGGSSTLMDGNVCVVDNGATAAPTIVVGVSNPHHRAVVMSANGGEEKVEYEHDPAACLLGSEDDLRRVSVDPLPRAAFCLYRSLFLAHGDHGNVEERDNGISDPSFDSVSAESGTLVRDADCVQAALVSLAYVKLESNDAAGCLEMCRLVLRGNSVDTNNNNAWMFAGRATPTDAASMRRMATVRVYACEAFCALDDAKSALVVLFGNDAALGEAEQTASLEALASGLSGRANSVTDAGGGASPQQRLNRLRIRHTRAVAHATASGAFASQGDFLRSKKRAAAVSANANLNVSSQANGGTHHSESRVRENQSSGAFENRVLLYSLLKEGDTEGAVVVLRGGGRLY